MARHRAPSRRTVVVVAAIGALTALASLLAPAGTGRIAGLEVVLLGPDGAGGPSARFDAATLARLRSPLPPRAEAADTLGPAGLPGPNPALPDGAAETAGAPGTGVTAAGNGQAVASAGLTPGESAAVEPADSGLPPEPAESPPRVRVPLVLAAQATGGSAARPASLRLAVPAPFRLVGAGVAEGVNSPESAPADGATPDGAGSAGASADTASSPTGDRGWGEPLTHYDVAVRGAPISADDGVVRLTEPDTLWLEYRERDTDCALDADSVPRFTRAVQPHPGTLRDVRVSYVLRTAADARRTGVLRLDLDVAPADAPEESFAAREVPDLRPGGFPLPDTLLAPRARYPGTCSDGTRSHPLTVQFLASDVSPARAYLVGAGAHPRLRLEDLNGDDVLEAEAWDPDGDGRFEARRTLALPLPRALQSSERREVLERQRAAVAARRAAEEAARRAAAARRARADSAAAQRPDSAPPPPPDGPAGGGG